MIHGMFCKGAVWQNYVDYFSDNGYTCLKPTLRWHDIDPGEKPDARLGTTSILDYVDDISRVVDALYDPPILMGHSMGGLIAQLLATQGRCKALVLLNPAPPAGIWSVFNKDMRKAFRRSRWKWGFWRKPFRITYKEASKAIFNTLPPERQRELYDALVFESGRVVSEIGLWFLDKKKATRVDASKITSPTLIVGSANDKITPIVITKKIVKKYKRIVTYKEFEGHSHWALGESGWEDIAEYVNSWLADHVDR